MHKDGRLELEIDEGLDIGGLDLDDHPNEENDEECLDNQRTASDERLGLVGEELRREMEHIAQEHQEGNSLVGGTPLEENLGLKLEPNLMEDLLSNAEGRSTEEYPQGSDKVEGQQTTDKS